MKQTDKSNVVLTYVSEVQGRLYLSALFAAIPTILEIFRPQANRIEVFIIGLPLGVALSLLFCLLIKWRFDRQLRKWKYIRLNVWRNTIGIIGTTLITVIYLVFFINTSLSLRIYESENNILIRIMFGVFLSAIVASIFQVVYLRKLEKGSGTAIVEKVDI